LAETRLESDETAGKVSQAPLTDREAREDAGRPALFRVVLDSEPDGGAEHGWRYDCQGEGEALRSL
jgi:hypothetical protein